MELSYSSNRESLMVRKFLFMVLVIISVITFSCDTVETTFDEALPERYELTTTVTPPDGGTIEPSGGTFTARSTIMIEAIPAEGYVFQHWEGDVTGNVNPRPLFFSGDRDVRAQFLFRDYPLNIQIVGEGTVNEEVISQVEESRAESGKEGRLTVDQRSEIDTGSGTGSDSGSGSQTGSGEMPAGQRNTGNQDNIQHNITDQTAGGVMAKSTGSGIIQTDAITVQLTAQPADGWIFDRWEGDLTGSENPAIIVVDEEKNVTVVFVETDPDQYTLQVQVQGEGIVTVDPSRDAYESGEEVSLTAEAASGWRFTGWQGDLSGNENPATLVMDDNKNVTAVFEQTEPDQYTLQVQVQGEGFVIVDPSQDSYEEGEEVSLTAEAASGWRFTRWQGDLSGNENPVTLVMNEDKNITAVFVQAEPDQFILNVEVQGEGSVTTDPSRDAYNEGEEVSLTAEAASGWQFTVWQGDLSGTENPATLVMDEDKNVTAVFVQDEPDRYTLQVEVQGEGSVNIDPDKGDYEEGEEVRLSAGAATGWRFTRWQGDLSGNSNPATLVMNEDKNVTAVFQQIGAPVLEITRQPSGSTAGNPISPSPEVKLSDDLGNPLSNVEISVSLNINSLASGSEVTVSTGEDGHAQFDNLIIETAANGYRLIFSTDEPGASDVVSGQFNVVSASPDASNSSADVPDGKAGEQTVIRITVQDQFDNPVGSVTGQLSVEVSGANSAAPSVVETTDAGTYTATYTPEIVGNDQIAVKINGTSVAGSPYSSSVSAGDVDKIEMVSGNNQSGQITRELDDPFVVRLVDTGGNPVAGETVEFSIVETPSGATGQRLSESSVTSDAGGLASSTLTLGILPGDYVVEVSAAEAGSVKFTASASLLPPSNMAITTQPTNTMAGEPINPEPAVRLTNLLNLPVADIRIDVKLNGGEFADGSTTRNISDNNGIAGFDNLVITAAGNGYTLTFEVDEAGLSPVTSAPFNVSAATADASESSANVPDGVVGEETRIIITVYDTYGNPVSGSGDLTVSVSGSNDVNVPVTESSTAGEYLAAYTPLRPGTDQITIRLSGDAISGSPYTSVIARADIDPSASTVQADPAQLKVGESSEVTVELWDGFNNPISGLNDDDFEISLSGHGNAGQIKEASTAGIYQFEVSSDSVGQVEVTVTADGITLDDRPVITFEIDLNKAKLGMYTQPEDSRAGQPIEGPPEVRIRDHFGNPAPGILVTVRERSDQSFWSGTLTIPTDGSGIASFNDLVINVVGRFQLEFTAQGVDGHVNSRNFQVNRQR